MNQAVLISGGAHVFQINHPFMASVFQTVPLSGDDWILVGLFACFPLFAETAGLMVKRAVRRRLSLLKV